MTTNVYDVDSAVVATDSRWSQTFHYNGKRYLRFIDDSGFEKIEYARDRAVLMFAGLAHLVQNWKVFFRSKPAASAAMPDFKGMSVCWVDCATRKVRFSAGDGKLRDCGSYFAGSGSLFALAYWQKTRKDAKLAVEYAKTCDEASGGLVKFFDIPIQTNNLPLQADVTAAQLAAMLATGGTTMEFDITTTNAVPTKVSPIAANSDLLNEINAGLANGSIEASAPSAPFEGMDQDWTPQQKQAFREALGELFEW